MNYKLSFILVTAILSLAAKADLKKLSNEFLKTNTSVQNAEYQLEFKKIDFLTERDKRDWGLNLSSNYGDSTLQASPTSFVSLDSKTFTNSLSLSKDTIWGGSFSASGSLIDGSYSSGDSVGYNQSLSYSQDFGKNFLGRNDYLSLDSKELLLKSSESGTTDIKQGALLGFMSNYIVTSLNKTLVELREQAVKRANRRTSLIKRQVRDGLKERADLYSAQTQEIQSREAVETARIDYFQSVEKLENDLHRKVTGKEVDNLTSIYKRLTKLPEVDLSKNANILAIQTKIDSLNKDYERFDNEVMPSISLSGGYTTNNYNDNASGALGDGTFGSDNREYKVGVSVTMPISFSVEKYNRSRSKVNVMIARNDLRKAKQDLVSANESLVKQVQILKKNIDAAWKRLDLAQKTLKEYNRLYERGRASLDQVINAEETLINTQISLASYVAKREAVAFNLYYLYSDLNKVIE